MEKEFLSCDCNKHHCHQKNKLSLWAYSTYSPGSKIAYYFVFIILLRFTCYYLMKTFTAQKIKFSIKDPVTFTEEILNWKQKTADLVTFTEEILNGKLHFFAVLQWFRNMRCILQRHIYHESPKICKQMIHIIKKRTEQHKSFNRFSQKFIHSRTCNFLFPPDSKYNVFKLFDIIEVDCHNYFTNIYQKILIKITAFWLLKRCFTEIKYQINQNKIEGQSRSLSTSLNYPVVPYSYIKWNSSEYWFICHVKQLSIIAEAYLEPCQTSNVRHFEKIAGVWCLTGFWRQM